MSLEDALQACAEVLFKADVDISGFILKDGTRKDIPTFWPNLPEYMPSGRTIWMLGTLYREYLLVEESELMQDTAKDVPDGEQPPAEVDGSVAPVAEGEEVGEALAARTAYVSYMMD